MPSENHYLSNPLHGVKLEQVINDLVDHYGWEILAAYMNINCFKTNPTVASSVKFLKKTDWAREKVEAFYLYQYHCLPKADDEQFLLPPRERIIPKHITSREPRELSFADAERIREKKAKINRQRNSSANNPWGE
jgi:uncharacterized protein (DUF2132 family)